MGRSWRQFLPAAGVVGLVLLVAACQPRSTRPGSPGEERDGMVWSRVWVEPALVYSGDGLTIIRARALDSIAVPVGEYIPPTGEEMSFHVGVPSPVHIALCNPSRVPMFTLWQGQVPRGLYRATFNPEAPTFPPLPAGEYFLKATVGDRVLWHRFLTGQR